MGEHEHENVQDAENVQSTEPSEEEVDSGNKVEVENPGDAPATQQDEETDAQDNDANA